ncbi:coiled-coil and C2 domain-containing protein 1B-like [Daphnia carinata]|uniref:coiled-coil and C2 domain-containing protein 1B-like n=1 Tax=Daphnia carinata TaxID=120202 RepID=UPI00257B57EB|nr:coiled-coil and C2 domain-containing protein 1B-like [Daphnia carinata]
MVPVRVVPLPPSTAPPIPPRVSVLNSVAEIDQQEPNECVLTQPSKDIEKALARRQEFKNAALQAKRAGEHAAALQLVRLVKVCDQMVDSAKQGLPVDWSCLPSVDIVGSENSIPPNVVEKASSNKENPPKVIGHYTQLVWATSYTVGCFWCQVSVQSIVRVQLRSSWKFYRFTSLRARNGWICLSISNFKQ